MGNSFGCYWTHTKISFCTDTISHIKYIYFQVHISPSRAITPSSGLYFLSPLTLRILGTLSDVGQGPCAWWPGCCSTGWEVRWRSGRCRPPCCCGLCGSDGLPWSWRVRRCCRAPLPSYGSETEPGNTCRTEEDMKRKIISALQSQQVAPPSEE